MQNITSDSDILSTCLEQIERGHATIETCIRRYPEFKELAELLHVACIMRDLPVPKLNPVSRSAIEQKMLTRFKQTQAVRAKQLIHTPRPSPTFTSRPARQSGGWVMRFASVAFVLIMIFFTGSAGLVQAASSAVPGDTLYQVKRSVEQFQLSVADKQSMPSVLEQIAEARLTEIKTLSDRGYTLDTFFVDDAMNSVREAIVAQLDYEKRDLLLWQARSTFVYAGERGAIQPEKQTVLVTMLDTVGNNPGDVITVLNDPTNTPTNTLTYTATFTETATNTATNTATHTATATSTKTKTPKPSNTPTSEPTSTPTRKPRPVQPTQPGGNNAGGNNGGSSTGGNNAGGNNGGGSAGGNNAGGNNGGGSTGGGNAAGNGGGNGNPPNNGGGNAAGNGGGNGK